METEVNVIFTNHGALRTMHIATKKLVPVDIKAMKPIFLNKYVYVIRVICNIHIYM